MKLIYNVKDRPPFGQVIVFAIQQLLAIMAATLVVPVITNTNAGLASADAMSPAAALMGAGIGTIVYLLFTKFKSPVFLGSSFAFLGSMAAAFAGATTVSLGYLGLLIGAAMAGLVYVIIAIIIKLVGVNWINKLMPPVVIGPIVSIIGLSLAGNAVGDIVKGSVTKDVPDYVIKTGDAIAQHIENGGKFLLQNDTAALAETSVTVPVASPYVALICGLITLAVVMICSTYGKKMARLIPFIIGILAGYAAALIFTLVGNAMDVEALKVLSFQPFNDLVANGVKLETFIAVPRLTFLKAFGAFGEVTGSYIATVAAAYVPVAFVVFAEHLADHKNISSIIETDLLEEPGLHRTLLGDGVGSIAGALVGGCPNTTYGESVGCVAITGNASVVTILTAAVGAILISFLSPFVAFVNSIPACVMGGVCMALYGFIAVSGLKMVQKVDLEQNRNLFVVSTILISGIGGLTLTFGKVTITSIACSLILGILANLLLSKADKKAEDK